MTVLAQALALFLRSNFFFTFFRGVFLFEVPYIEVSENPGNSPCFQCFFLATADDDEEEEEDEVEVVALGGGGANAQWMKVDGFG